MHGRHKVSGIPVRPSLVPAESREDSQGQCCVMGNFFFSLDLGPSDAEAQGHDGDFVQAFAGMAMPLCWQLCWPSFAGEQTDLRVNFSS